MKMNNDGNKNFSSDLIIMLNLIHDVHPLDSLRGKKRAQYLSRLQFTF